jgi:PTS system galactitol-specific IIA component
VEAQDMKMETLLIRDTHFRNKEDALESISNHLYNMGYVKSSFCKGIVSREAVYPTGLPIDKINVAIPHTDAEHVIKPVMVVVIPDHTVEFHVMGDNEKIVDVDIMFVLALKSPESQLQTLQELMGLIQDEDKLTKIKSVKTRLELKQILAV